jgi:chromosomal replication initiation ATPase DnaA
VNGPGQKAALREIIPTIAFSNWFDGTRQVERVGASLTVSAPDKATCDYLETEYRGDVLNCVSAFGIEDVKFIVVA